MPREIYIDEVLAWEEYNQITEQHFYMEEEYERFCKEGTKEEAGPEKR